MSPEPMPHNEFQDERAANLAQADAAHREAYDFWGYLFKEDKCGTPLLDRLLKGIAYVISQKFGSSDSPDLTPSQIAAWYRSVGGDYDVLFTDTPPSSVAFIYRSLGAFHSLQPAPDDDGYSSPTIPALKKDGFVTWQTIQLLLGPEEHVPFLQKAVELDDIPDLETGGTFPKILPKECFPEKPDDAMETWYQSVAARLKKEAEEELNGGSAAEEPKPRTSTDSEGNSADDKSGAYRYFEDPLYRNGRPRPTFMRHVSKQSPRPAEDHGRPGAIISRTAPGTEATGTQTKMPHPLRLFLNQVPDIPPISVHTHRDANPRYQQRTPTPIQIAHLPGDKILYCVPIDLTSRPYRSRATSPPTMRRAVTQTSTTQSDCMKELQQRHLPNMYMYQLNPHSSQLKSRKPSAKHKNNNTTSHDPSCRHAQAIDPSHPAACDGVPKLYTL
ncbi:uncharacterized protein J4E84_004009 [Alternaria hordeiaustralica]|uniref:uncharacterized protein n=1 Tax=Alternaria hordeiaustralica TaxID=1187925 RepID=UPI0020C3537A|nr:uncharacterized protein J4E84_004009 [Alternaria hordeiaustralica]KAI4689829.1 hypothetical protein J4E84_004009 [Alternaria hordeiaustralica]